MNGSFDLRQKILLTLVVEVIVLTSSLLFMVESRQRASIIRHMENRGVIIATQLAAVSTIPLMASDFVTLEQDVEKVSRTLDVLYAIILDHAGQVAAYSGHDEKQGTVLTDAVSQQAAATRQTLIQRVRGPHDGRSYYDITVPVFRPGHPKKWGAVRVGLSLRDMWAEIHRTRLQVLLGGVAGIVLATVVSACLAHRIAAPIRDLTATTAVVARGVLCQVTPVRSRDEIAVLAANFNHMTSELAQPRAALERTQRELDAKVQALSIAANYNANILASMHSGLLTLELAGRFETVNTMAERILDMCGTDVRGQRYQQVLAPYTPFLHVIETSYQSGTPRFVSRMDLDRPDGQQMPINLRTAMLQDSEARTVGLVAIFEDVSPLQTLEHRLR